MKPDVIIIGAGPAGLSAAIELGNAGANVTVVDEQAAPGGQVYRAIENVMADSPTIADWLGPDYASGADLIAHARGQANVEIRTGTSVWDIARRTDDFGLGLVHGDDVSSMRAAHVIVANGAMERPTPFPGWTLPGVMGIGAAQTLLKESSLLPSDDVVIAGSGPLLYLFMHQLLNAGVTPRAVLDTGPKWVEQSKWSDLLAAAWSHAGQLTKGLGWRSRIARSGVPHLFGLDKLEAVGSQVLENVRYRQAGRWHDIATGLLLVHDGVVPNTVLTMAARCEHVWQAGQRYWRPKLTADGETTQPGLWVAGDGGGIMGADAARLQGRILGRRLATRLGLPGNVGREQEIRRDIVALDKLRRLRRFLDVQYSPAELFSHLDDEITICRCEAVRAGEIRGLGKLGCTGPNQARAFSRAGMGPCMGRQCGVLVSTLLAEETGATVADVGYYSARAPLKPISIGQLASLREP